jgi:hypothetical protein
MSLSLSALRTAIAAQIETKLDASTQPANCYAYPPDSPELNAVLILPRSGPDGKYMEYHGTFHGSPQGALCTIALRVELRCGGGQIDAAKAMDAYLSAGNAESVVDALLADPTLAAACETLSIGGASAPGWFASSDPTDARTWLSSSFDIDISARR